MEIWELESLVQLLRRAIEKEIDPHYECLPIELVAELETVIKIKKSQIRDRFMVED